MKISNKIESSIAIKNLHLNYFPEQIFKAGQEKEILEFVNKYPAQYYAVRDKSKAGGVFKLKVEKEDILKETKNYDLFSINVSSFNYVDNQVLVGEIQVSDDMLSIIVSTNNKHSLRDAYKNPDFNLKTDIFDKTLDKIPCFDRLYKYIVSKNLQNMVVEFALFNEPVGVNKENIIVYELRTEY